jgi:outer membrane protein assembly factor BamB
MTRMSPQFSAANIQNLREALRLGIGVVTELWFYPTKDWVTSAHAADIDGDGEIEVLIGSRDGFVRVLTNKGSPKWHVEQPSEWVGIVRGINNIDAKDATRLVFGSRKSQVYAYNETGDFLWQYSTMQVVRSIRICDINHDGKDEIIIGSEDWSVHVLSSTTGELLWKYDTKGWIRGLSAYDIDGDGEIEILAASGDRYLYVLNGQGQLKWRFDTRSKVHSIFPIDLDGDGEVEILLASDAKDLYAITPDGKEKWRFSPENRIHSINVADVNNDGYLEVIAGSEDEHIYFLDAQGQLIWKYFLGKRIFSIFAIDLNRDGIQEIIVGAEDDRVHVLRVELINGLRDKILDCHRALGSPSPDWLDLSPTEYILLQDLVSGLLVQDLPPTMDQAKQAIDNGDYLQALSVLHMLKEQRFQQLWQKDVGYVRSICLGEKVGDSDLQILIGTDTGDIRALDIQGSILWSHLLTDRIRSVQLGDVDHDGMVEIVTVSFDGHVYILSKTGEAIRQFTLQEIIESVYVTHSEAQGYPEIILGTVDKRIHIYGEQLQLTRSISTPQGIRAVCSYDLDGDGIEEIIAGAIDDKVYAYTRDGQLLWSYPTRDRVRAFHIRDIDNDGQVEIIVGSEDRNVYVLNNQGHLKWRYYTPHRVLDIDVIDLDHDGQLELLVGVGNGSVYVFNGFGDLLWRYQANDRVRAVRAADLNKDGIVEVIVGSEDRLYMLQMVDQQQLQKYMEICWQALIQLRPVKEVLDDLIQQPDPHLRAFAITKWATHGQLTEEDFSLFHDFLDNSSTEVRKAFASQIATLYKANSSQARRLFEQLTTDLQGDIRFTFIDHLSALTRVDSQVGFEYLDRFRRSVNRWIRRAVVRQLDLLVDAYPQQVLRLFLATIQDDNEWVRQESALTATLYLDMHTDRLLTGLRLLITQRTSLSLLELIIDCAKKPLVQKACRAFTSLISLLPDENVLEKLKEAVDILDTTRSLTWGEIIWKIHMEFYCLHRMSTTEEIASYKYIPYHDQQEVEEAHFEGTLRVLQRLGNIADILRIYQRREGLGDRIVSLLEATASIDTLLADIEHGQFWSTIDQEYFTDWCILKPLLIRWRTIVTTELSRLRGKANLKAELQTKHVQQEEHISILLSVSNDGRSPADNVKVRLNPGETFTIIGASTYAFETVSTRQPVQAEFTINPHAYPIHLTFEITYEDAEGRDKVLHFGDRLEIKVSEGAFKHIPNPYSVGIPIQDPTMFYGRRMELAFLKENLAYSLANTVIVLYGQRRSGKSSLLYQLVKNTDILQPHIPVYIDMQHETIDLSTNKFLYIIARHIYRQLKRRGISITLPDQTEFEKDATFTLDLFLEDTEDILGDRKLVLLIDEFEVLEQKVKEQVLSQGIFEYLRSLMQHRRGINFLLSGTHTIEQLTAGYWSVFFNIARHRRLSKLNDDAAKQLISQPVKDFLEYDPFAIEKIRLLTGDQPYLVQLICRSLIEHCNRHHKNYVTINDVNTVHNEVMETGNIHFKWIWEQTSPEERAVLSIMAQEGGEEGRHLSPSDIEDICHDYGMSYERKTLGQALQKLVQADIIEEIAEGSRFRISVGLTRRWVREAKPLRKVIQEENLQAH